MSWLKPLVKPFVKGVKKGFKDFGLGITAIVNAILLTLVYVIGVGLTAIVAKIFGKHFMDVKKQKNIKTYWKELNLKKEPTDNYYRQF